MYSTQPLTRSTRTFSEKNAQSQHVFLRQLYGHLTDPASSLCLSNTNTQLKACPFTSLQPWFLAFDINTSSSTSSGRPAPLQPHLLSLSFLRVLLPSSCLLLLCASAFLTLGSLHLLSVCNILFCTTGCSLHTNLLRSQPPSDPIRV